MQGPPNNPWGQPPYPPGQPQQEQPHQHYGQPHQHYGQPHQHYGQPPQQQGYGPPGYPPQPAGGFGANPYPSPAMQHQGPVASVGLFGHLPCPHCGMHTRSSAGGGAQAARFAGGLVGWLIASAFLTKYYCLSHGEIPAERFPLPHQSAITSRKIMKVGGGVFLLVFVLAVLGAMSLVR